MKTSGHKFLIGCLTYITIMWARVPQYMYLLSAEMCKVLRLSQHHMETKAITKQSDFNDSKRHMVFY